jgi:uncharacterized repeat protein (TIGR01451 family)
LIEINGQFAGAGANGLRINANNCVIKGLVINRFTGNGIQIDASGDTIQSCFIGTSASGQTALANGGNGILINSGSNNLIGGTGTGASNIISGNANDGVQLGFSAGSANRVVGNNIGVDVFGGQGVPNGNNGVEIFGGSFNVVGGPSVVTPSGVLSSGNVISGNKQNGVFFFGGVSSNSVQGNIIGLDGTGALAIPNGSDGIGVLGANRNLIGGTLAGTGNVISGNKGPGIGFVGGANFQIEGNLIGTDKTGTLNRGNGGAGIDFNGGDNTVVGGPLNNAGNVIAFNGQSAAFGAAGVSVFSGTGITITSNSIFSNTRLGIDLGADGVTANHPGGSTSGPNLFQNYPVLSQAVSGAGRTLIQGTISAVPDSSYLIQFFTNPSADPSGFGQGKSFIGQTPVTTDGNGNAIINVVLPNPSVIGSFVSATATDSIGDTSEFSSDVKVGVAQLADLGLTLSASPTPATLNQTLTYTLTVTNTGPNDATGVNLIDTLPSSVVFNSASTTQGTFTQVGTSVTANFGTIPVGSSATLTIAVTPTSLGIITDTATVSSSQIDPDLSNNTQSLNTTVSRPADLGVTIQTDPDTTVPVLIGDQLVYTIIVTNAAQPGQGPATNVMLTNTLPTDPLGNPEVSVVAISSGAGTFTQSNGVITFNLGTISNGAAVAARIVVEPLVTGSIVDNATVSSDETDPNLSDNTTSVTNTVEPSHDLGVAIAASPEPALIGQNLTYTVTITNAGPSDATLVSVNDLLPSDVNLVSAVSSQGTVITSSSSVLANLGTIPDQGSATLTIVVVPTKSEIITDTATLIQNPKEGDPNPANDTASHSTAVSPADLAVSIVADPVIAIAGNNLTYTVTVHNNGIATADGVKMVEQLPAGVTVASPPSAGQGTASVANGIVTAALGILASGASTTVTIVVIPSASGLITDTANVSANEVDSDLTNNTASLQTQVSPADVGVVLSANPEPVLVAGNLVYTAVVTNAGPVAATGVILSDSIPNGASFSSATASQGTVVLGGGTVIATLGTLAPGAQAIVTIILNPTTIGALDNTVVVKADQFDPNPLNNTSRVTSTVFNQPGEFEFSAPTFQVSEGGGFATITVLRTNGTLGAATVTFTTSDGTGRAGIDYVPAVGVLQFADGQQSATFTVPVIENHVHGPNLTVNLTLSTPQGGPGLGQQTTAVLTILNDNPDLIGPVVSSLQLLGSGRAITGVLLSFSKPLDPGPASNPANFILSGPGRSGRPALIPIRSVSYNAFTNTILVTPSRALSQGTFYQIIVNGSAPLGLTDTAPAHNLLDGTGNNQNGTSYVASFIRASSIKYADSHGNTVSFQLRGGGVLDLVRSGTGEGDTLTLVGARPFRSVLSGSVRAGRSGGTGVTTLKAIHGLEPFGGVKSTLTTPPFFVGNQPLVSAQVQALAATSQVAASFDAVLASGQNLVASARHRRKH